MPNVLRVKAVALGIFFLPWSSLKCNVQVLIRGCHFTWVCKYLCSFFGSSESWGKIERRRWEWQKNTERWFWRTSVCFLLVRWKDKVTTRECCRNICRWKNAPFPLFGFFCRNKSRSFSSNSPSSAFILKVWTGREKKKQNEESNCRLEFGFTARHRAELATTWSHFSRPPGKWKSNIHSHFCRVFGRRKILREIMWLMSLTLCSAANFVCDLLPNRFYYSSSRRNRCLL